MQIKTLAGIDPITVMEAFNEGFSDYSLSIQYAPEQWAYKIQSENVQWELSVGAFDRNRLVAFILHGTKTRDGQQWVYNGGTAVIPSYRGQRLTQKLYDYIVPRLKSQNKYKVLLEVIDTNTPAIKSYENSGFEDTRRFLCFKGPYTQKKQDGVYKISPLTDFNNEILQSFWDIMPSWQNDFEAIVLTQNANKGLGIYHQGTLTGYLMYNPSNNRILQLAVAPSHRRKGMGKALLDYAFYGTDKDLVIINVEDTAIGTIAFLQHLGLKNFVTLREMELVLGTKGEN